MFVQEYQSIPQDLTPVLFINADVLASVACIGRSVTDVFGAGSEDKFNQTLTEILRHQVTQENIMVTTDDNVACDPKAREILKSEFTVYIEVSTSVQAERMSDYRPLLPVTDYSALLDGLQKENNSWFAEVASSFTINSDNGDIERDAKRKSTIGLKVITALRINSCRYYRLWKISITRPAVEIMCSRRR